MFCFAAGRIETSSRTYICYVMLTGSGRKGSKSNKIIIWAVPIGVVFFLLLAALGYFVVKSRRLHRSFYRLVRNDDFDQGITYHNTGKEILFRVEIIL